MPQAQPRRVLQLGWALGVAAACLGCDEKVDDSYRDDLVRLDEVKVTPVPPASPGHWFVDVILRNLTEISVPNVHDWRITAGTTSGSFDTLFDTTKPTCAVYPYGVQPETAQAFRVMVDLGTDPASFTSFCDVAPNSFDPPQVSYQAARLGAAPVADFSGPVKVELWATMNGADCHTDDCPVNAHASASAPVTAATP